MMTTTTQSKYHALQASTAQLLRSGRCGGSRCYRHMSKVDSCASGGRRLDFEMQRRSLALWRSDLCWEPTAEQCMTYALSLWMPLHGVGSISLQPYDLRSGMGSTFSLALNYQNPSICVDATRLLEEYQSVRHYFADLRRCKGLADENK